jgi:hypothetical protein
MCKPLGYPLTHATNLHNELGLILHNRTHIREEEGGIGTKERIPLMEEYGFAGGQDLLS